MKSIKFIIVATAIFITACGEQKTTIETKKADTLKVSKPLVCSLTTEEQEKREVELKTIIFSRVTKTTELEDGYEFSFNEKDTFLLNLMEYINLERKCCNFFTFTITMLPEEGETRLKIGNGNEVKKLLKMEMDGMNLK